MAKKLLDQVRDVLRVKRTSCRAEEAYVDWIRRFILFHHKRHPAEMGAQQIQAFVAHRVSHLLHAGCDVRTTMIYTHVLQRGGLAVRSPLDL